MKKLSQLLMASGGTVTVIGAMCDTNGTYYNYLIAAIFFGLIMVASGMVLYRVWEAQEEARRKDLTKMQRRTRDEPERSRKRA